MAQFTVHLREKIKGSIEVEALDMPRALSHVRNMIKRNELPDGVMEESAGIVVAFAEEI